MVTRLLEMIGEDLRQRRQALDPRAGLEQLHSLRFERMSVAQVLDELLAQILGPLVAQGGARCRLPSIPDAVGHRALLGADAGGELRHSRVARPVGDPAQQLVGGKLHVLVGIDVHRELAGCVRVCLGEQDHAPSTEPSGDVLDGRRSGVAPLELRAHQPLVLARLYEMLLEDGGQLAVTGDVRRSLHLHERLFLDRMNIAKVVRQLLFFNV